jgi:transposase
MDLTTYGIDIAKNVMQVHWVEPSTGEIRRKKLSRAKFVEFFASLQPARLAMEACGGAHHWARKFAALGHTVELLPARQIRGFVRGNKDDAADAQAIWMAARQPHIRRAPIKSAEQQAIQSLHRTRAHWISVRTATINMVRGLLYEFGVTLPQGREAAMKALSVQRAHIDAHVPELHRRALEGQLHALGQLAGNIKALDHEIKALHSSEETARKLSEIPGVGPIGATALMATLGDGKAWRSGREFSASLGLCPGHTGTGGKVRMGGITKRGDPYLRTVLISGARAVAISPSAPEWMKRLLERRPVNVAVVALANKLARIAWALVARERAYDPLWKSVAPGRA